MSMSSKDSSPERGGTMKLDCDLSKLVPKGHRSQPSLMTHRHSLTPNPSPKIIAPTLSRSTSKVELRTYKRQKHHGSNTGLAARRASTSFANSIPKLNIDTEQVVRKKSAPTIEDITPSFDQGTVSEILPYLYLGSNNQASQVEHVKSIGVTLCINAQRQKSSLTEFDNHKIRIINLEIEDNLNTKISPHFNKVIGWIETEHQAGGKILINCRAGVSRSATLVIAYLMKIYPAWNFKQAYEFVKSKREIISPNLSFIVQLQEFEDDLIEKRSNIHNSLMRRNSTFSTFLPISPDRDPETDFQALSLTPDVSDKLKLRLTCSDAQESAQVMTTAPTLVIKSPIEAAKTNFMMGSRSPCTDSGQTPPSSPLFAIL